MERQTEFANANALARRATVRDKQMALAEDYLEAGKDVEWVLMACCGTSSKPKDRKAVIDLAFRKRKINAKRQRQLYIDNGIAWVDKPQI